jgi:UDP-glucuronate 4-epimerase
MNNSLPQRRICITGAAGFIGFHTAQRLVAEGHDIIGIDNFNDYYPPTLKRDRARLLADVGVKVFEVDIADREKVAALLAGQKTTLMIHLAAHAGVRYSLKHPEIYLKSNINGFLNILEACRMQGGIPCVYASSSSVYGKNQKIPFSVKDTTDQPANIYGMTKKTKELMAHVYNHLYELPVVGLRFFTVYGPWGRPDMAYYLFTKSILEGEPINIYNHGNMWRDFTYIDDIVDGIVAACEISSGYHLFNLGNNNKTQLRTFVETIEEACGKKAEKNFVPMPHGEMVETYADIEESERLLGFRPKMTLRQGIQNFVNWYRAYHSV